MRETREQYELRRLAEKHRAFINAIQPIIKMKVSLLNYKVPSYIVTSDSITMEFDYTPEEKETLRLADEIIEQTRCSIFQR